MRGREAAYSIEEQRRQFEVDTRITSKDIHRAGQRRAETMTAETATAYEGFGDLRNASTSVRQQLRIGYGRAPGHSRLSDGIDSEPET